MEGRAEYAFADGAHVTLVRAVDSDDLLVEVKGSVPYVATGAWKLVKSETLAETTYYQFGRVHDAPLKSLAASYVAATNEVAARSRVIRVSTPDPLLDSAVACANLSCDAILEGDFATCSASAWHLIWCGWRSVYAPVVLGMTESWNEAEIETPYFSYRWTRAGGVEVTKNPRHLAVTVKQTVPTLVGDKMPRPHTRWGMPKGDGTAVRPSGAEPRFVSLAGVVNRNWRTLHQGT